MSRRRPFVLVTGNPHKAREAERILGYRPPHEPLDLPEIQSLDLVEVLRAKAEEAWRRLGRTGAVRALVVDETGLALAALGGFPGPLVKWMLQAVGPEGIARTAHRLGDPRATAQCALVYRDGEREVIASADVPGRLAETPRGDAGFGWDPIFVPAGQDRTYAEMSAREKDLVGHRGAAWRRLREQLSGTLEEKLKC